MSGKFPFITMQGADCLYSFWSPGGFLLILPHHAHLVASTGLDGSHQLSSAPTSSPREAITFLCSWE